MQDLVFCRFSEIEPKNCPGLTLVPSPVIIDIYRKICTHAHYLLNEIIFYGTNKK